MRTRAIKVDPYTGQPGIICMPLVRNVGTPKSGYTLTSCPVCGSACWSNNELIAEARKLNPGIPAACTECAIRLNWVGGESCE